MLVLAVTHPDPVSRNPRSLSEGGRQQALMAARRLRELTGKKTSLAAVVSSPTARCLETAIIVAREFGETTRDDGTYDGRVHVSTELEEAVGPAKGRAELEAALRSHMTHDDGKAVLLAVHGDLANMLSGAAEFTKECASGDDWFDVRPVIAVFEYAVGQITLKFCETLRGGCWISSLVHSTS